MKKCILTYEQVDCTRLQVSPCCMFEHNDPSLNLDRVKSLDEIFYSDLYQNLRQSLDNGIFHDFCFKCKSDEQDGIISERQIENAIRKNHSVIGLQSLKIALDTTCNMMCRICHPMLSSKWYSAKSVTEKIKDLNNYDIKPIKYDIENIIKNSNIKNLKRLRIVGGEPFYSKKLDWFIDYLIENTDYKNLHIYFTTNGSIFPKEELLKKLLKCKKLHIEFSIDAIGELSQLCRWGVDWNTIENNIYKWKEIKSNVVLNIHATISIYNVNRLQDLVDFAKKNNIFLNADKLRRPEFLCINQFSLEQRQKWMLSGQDTIEKMFNKIIINNEPVLNSKNNTIKFNNVLDNYQKTSLKTYNREIYDLIYD